MATGTTAELVTNYWRETFAELGASGPVVRVFAARPLFRRSEVPLRGVSCGLAGGQERNRVLRPGGRVAENSQAQSPEEKKAA